VTAAAGNGTGSTVTTKTGSAPGSMLEWSNERLAISGLAVLAGLFYF
jgi:hypothetical protein